MISFDNTEIAFSGKTNADLNRSYWLFKLVSNSRFVNIGSTLTKLAIAIRLPIKPIIKATIFKQFCGGENIEECSNTINQLGKYGIGAILDYSVEGSETEQAFDACMKETIATVEYAKKNKKIPFCVFKTTGLARFAILEKVTASIPLTEIEKAEYEKVKARVYNICKTAFDNGVPIFIDAEESWIQQAIDDLANEMMGLFNKQSAIVYNTFQLYRKDRLKYLEESYLMALQRGYHLGAKLVRGAYMEKERMRALENHYTSPIQDTKEQADHDYNAALRFCVDRLDKIAICAGTHNEQSSFYLVQIMKEKNIQKNHSSIYFSQLFGMSDHISYNLAKEGFNVVKYVPYGPVEKVLPYLIRRAQENTSVKGQTGRELGLIIKEKQRRKANA